MTVTKTVLLYVVIFIVGACFASCASKRPARRSSFQELIEACSVPHVNLVVTQAELFALEQARRHCEVDRNEAFCIATACLALQTWEKSIVDGAK